MAASEHCRAELFCCLQQRHSLTSVAILFQPVERLWRLSCLQRWHSLRSVAIFFTSVFTYVATFLPPTVAQPKVCSDFLSSTMAQRVERLWRFSCLQRWHSLRSVVIFFPQRWHNESNVCGDFLASNGGTAKGAGAPKHEVAVKLPLCVNHLVTGRCQS